ncbi:MAG: 50S ribosomal protein L35 [Sedimentisphaerales bacterium]|nr:50S ribosomal protein L35 [Sedimentisphaerales bacterium]
MPKQKTHKGLKKRFKVTATGKLSYKRAGAGHLMSTKNAKRRRHLASPAVLSSTAAAAKTIKIFLNK